MQDIDLELLRCFASVAELRSFTAAGARLGRSQSAVSVRIKKLEDLLGAQLLTRNNQDVQLTERGKVLLTKARHILEESERLMSEMRGPSVSGKLRIGLLEYIAPHRLPEIMTALQRKLPSAEVQFHVGLSSTLKTALTNGNIDLALALNDDANATSTVIAEDRLVWVEHEEANLIETSPELELCLMERPCIYREAALETLSQAGLEYREVMTGNSVQAVRNAVRSGMGVTVLGSSSVGPGHKVARNLEGLGPLPTENLCLHGNDPRRPDLAMLL
ncbi:MAG: LysR family transcriptional regulator, partial [Litoreibacter sp.]|nr:LysR family transcriptional regulator [Litoreibacter sp.]